MANENKKRKLRIFLKRSVKGALGVKSDSDRLKFS